MLENGRARSFSQSSFPEVKSAIDACPVDCMHQVAFHELKEFESARDHGDGRTDHRHMTSHTPLNVAGIDSDANHKSSWYHYLKHKCHGESLNCAPSSFVVLTPFPFQKQYHLKKCGIFDGKYS